MHPGWKPLMVRRGPQRISRPMFSIFCCHWHGRNSKHRKLGHLWCLMKSWWHMFCWGGLHITRSTHCQVTKVSVFQTLRHELVEAKLLVKPFAVISHIVVQVLRGSFCPGWALEAYIQALPRSPKPPDVEVPLPIPTQLHQCESFVWLSQWLSSSLEVFATQRSSSFPWRWVDALKGKIETPCKSTKDPVEGAVFHHHCIRARKQKESAVTNGCRPKVDHVHAQTHHLLHFVLGPKTSRVPMKSEGDMRRCAWVVHRPGFLDSSGMFPEVFDVRTWHLKANLTKQVWENSMRVNNRESCPWHSMRRFGTSNRYSDRFNLLSRSRSLDQCHAS